jgi:hypothetical protein
MPEVPDRGQTRLCSPGDDGRQRKTHGSSGYIRSYASVLRIVLIYGPIIVSNSSLETADGITKPRQLFGLRAATYELSKVMSASSRSSYGL